MSHGDPPDVVATDLDGTLLRSNGALSDRTRAALVAVEEAGVHVVVVTARPPRWMHDLIGVVGRHGVALCANGAFVYSVAERRLLAQHPLQAELVRRIAARLRTELPGTVFAVETADGFGRESDFPMHPMDAAVVGLPAAAGLYQLAAMPAAPLEDLLWRSPGKLLARNETLAPQVFVERVRELLGADAVLAYSGAAGLAEISAPGVTKAAALADWCGGLGVAAEAVWAFGDMPNDLSMLSWAGRAHAVANAHPEVLAAADVICASNDDDRVAAVVEAALAGLA